MRNTIYAIFCFCLFTNCNSQKSESDFLKVININPDKAAKTILMSEISNKIQFVPLHTDDENLIGEIQKVIYKNDFIYISDGSSIYKFFLDGKLNSKIQKRGGGPNEYSGISDFQIDSNDMVWLLSRNNKTLYKYGWDNEMKESILLNDWVNRIYLDNNNHMFFYMGNLFDNNNNFRLKLFDLSTKQIINEYLEIDPYKEKYLHVGVRDLFHTEKNLIYFFELFNDTIYTITLDKISPTYKLNFENRNIPESFYKENHENIADFFQNLFKYNYAYGPGMFIKADRKFILTYYYNQTCFMGIIDDRKEVTYNFSSIIENIELGGFPITLTGLNMSKNENKIIIPLIPSDIVDYAKDNLLVEEVNLINKKLNYPTEDSNPVILIIDFSQE